MKFKRWTRGQQGQRELIPFVTKSIPSRHRNNGLGR